VSRFRRLARAVKQAGARAAFQLHYPPVPDPAALDGEEIAQVVTWFGQAARRAREAGFDAAEIQASHRSLLAQLLSPATNRRRDRYGRGVAGRVRALGEILGVVRREAGAAFPVIVKFSADEYRSDGITPEMAQEIARALVDAGADALEVIAGSSASEAPIRLSAGVGEATQAELAAAVKQVVDVPVLAAGRILSSDTAEQVLRERQGDLVSLGRALLADPAWAAKVHAGIDLEIIPCIGCMACFTPAPDGATGCPVNGEAGREHLPPLALAGRPQRIAVLGASLAGLEFARVAAIRGHHVQIVGGDLPLGGLLGLRAGVPGNAEFGRAFLYFGERLNELGVNVVDAPEPPVDLTLDCRPAPEVRPAWAQGKGVLLAGELLGRDLHQLFGIGRRVAVVGPGALAAEVALFLSGWGRRPWVIVPGSDDEPFPDVHPMHAARLLERLQGYKVPLVTGATVIEWRYDEDRKSAMRVLRHGREETLRPFHSAVSAAGWPLSTSRGARSRVAGPGLADGGAFVRWPAAAFGPRLPKQIPVGATLTLGDTPYAEPLRDLVAYAHQLARRI
jgi:2,4-dienoyl-CoA reductase-like NADH-dependent reductase (Old Yellow Enzyme family)